MPSGNLQADARDRTVAVRPDRSPGTRHRVDRGIGAAIAEALAPAGARVSVNGRDPGRTALACESLLARLETDGVHADLRPISFDVGDYAASSSRSEGSRTISAGSTSS